MTEDKKKFIPDFDKEDPLLAKFRADIPYIGLLKLHNLGITNNEIRVFQKNVSIVYYPWNRNYNSLRFNVNRRFNIFPLIIVMAKTRADVKNAFNFALKHNIPVSIRSGAHNNEGYSLCSGMIIDQSKRNKVTVNEMDFKSYQKSCIDNNCNDKKKPIRVTVEAGALNGDLVIALNKYHLAIPAGTCPNVGVSGLTLGGGVGFLMRRYGLTSDNLVDLNIVLADGSSITVDKKNYKDLFWACRGGGGGNFGIVTDFTFNAFAVPEVSIFELTYDLDDIEPTLKLWQMWAPSTTNKITAEYNIASASSLTAKEIYNSSNRLLYKPQDKASITIDGLYLGNKEDLEVHLKQFLKSTTAKPLSHVIESMSYADAARHFAGKPHRLPFFKNKSSYVVKPLRKEDIAVIKSFFENAPFDSRLEFQAFGGAVKNNIEKTAFAHRNALYWCGFSTLWYDEKNAEEHMRWVRELWNAFQPFSNNQSYVNFSDSDLGDKYMEYYYGRNRDRLIEIKNRYDPKYIFNFPQVIKRII